MLSDGQATVGFDFGDGRLSYRVRAFAHTLDGRLGANTGVVLPPRPLPAGGPAGAPAGR